MRRLGWVPVRFLGALAVLGALLWQMGSEPFFDGVRLAGGWPLVVGGALTVPITMCCAWRWSLVAEGLGVGVPLGAAVSACYRSQFLNTALPGGVLGDVDRGARHGRDVGDTASGLRAVAWERLAGQVVQVAATLVVLALVPSPVRSSLPAVVVGVLGVGAGAAAVSCTVFSDGGTRRARVQARVRADLRSGLLARHVWPGVTLASFAAVVGHLATFLVAARAAGVTATPLELLPLALLVLLAMAIPFNLAGWGPREGVAAWVFAAAGLGAAQGVTTAVVYGVIVFGSGLPGAAVMLVSWLRRAESRRVLAQPQPSLATAGRRAGHG
jgi:uncharacterized membrane protein YbhN (UPF0104 family)